MLLEQYNATKAEFKKAKHTLNKKKRKYEASIQAIFSMFSVTRIKKHRYHCYFKAHPQQTFTLIRTNREWTCYDNTSHGSLIVLTNKNIDMLCVSLYKTLMNKKSTTNEPPEC